MVMGIDDFPVYIIASHQIRQHRDCRKRHTDKECDPQQFLFDDFFQFISIKYSELFHFYSHLSASANTQIQSLKTLFSQPADIPFSSPNRFR